VTRTGKGVAVAVPAKSPDRKMREAAFGSMTIGRAGMMRINALEGIVTSDDTHARLAEFDRKGLTPAERRAAIVEAYSRGR